MVVKHPTLGGIVVNALSTWTVDVVVRFENGGTAAFGAGGAVGVDLGLVLGKVHKIPIDGCDDGDYLQNPQ